MNKATAKGFTIVELLIVIVVIAILAAITVVAFNGMQDRAYASKASSAADSVIKALALYQVEHGTYPDTGDEDACIGTAADYPAKDGFVAGECFKEDEYNASVSSALNSDLSIYLSTIPNGSLPGMNFYGASARGLLYSSMNDSTGGIIMYFQKLGQKCPQSSEYDTEDSEDGGYTRCVIRIGNTTSPK